MSRPNPASLAVLIAVLLVLAPLPVLVKGGLFASNFEADAMHLADIVLRMAAGGRPHLDFMTPLGALSFWPFVPFVRAGWGMGHAFAFGQVLFAVPLAGALWWACATRLPRVTGHVFAAVTVILATSLAHSHAGLNTALSLHYNRWAWALVFVATLLVALPSRRAPAPVADGILVAALLAAAALVKATYAVAFVPALILIAILRGERRMLAAGALAGAVLAGVLVLILGFPFLAAYAGDLATVRATPLRGAASLAVHDLLAAPATLAQTLVLFAAAFVLRRAGRQADGLAVLVLLPAFVFVTWQNFDNEADWLLLLAALLAAQFDSDRTGLARVGGLAAIAAVLAIPIVTVHGLSWSRHLSQAADTYVRIVDDRDEMRDLFMPRRPAYLVRTRVEQTEPGGRFTGLAQKLERPEEPVTFAGENFGACQLMTGLKGTAETIVADLGPGELRFFPVDILSSYWLYGATPLPGAAPWNYGTLGGIEAATHLLVPACPMSVRTRNALLEMIDAAGTDVSLVRRTPGYALFAIRR